MTRTSHWCIALAALTAAPVGAQERVPASPNVVARAEVAAEQVPLAVKVRVPLESRVVTGAPYSADVITESIETLADGNRIVRRTAGRVYRDGQGRVRRDEDRDAGQAASITITDPVAGVSYILDPEQKIALKTERVGVERLLVSKMASPASPHDPAEVERKRIIEHKIAEQVLAGQQAGEGSAAGRRERVMIRRAPGEPMDGAPPWDEKVEKLPVQEVEGVMAEGTRTTRTIPAGAIGNERPIVMVTEEWRSPELQVLVATTTSDPRTGESSYRLTNIVRGEPAPATFEIPAGYTLNENVMIKRMAK